MATEKRQVVVSLDTSLLELAMSYGAEHGIPLETLIEQGLRLRFDRAPAPAIERSSSTPLPDLEALADRRIREQLPRIVREWLESARGATCLERLMLPYVSEAGRTGPGSASHATGEGDTVDVPLPRSVLARLQQQRMIRLEEVTGVDIPTLHLLRTGRLSRLPRETLDRLVAGLEQVEADREADYELEGMHG